ncbi:MAG: magnesium transporter [Oscillospiraceae bacterium]|nr:magnesium transporter [Oscillospiraceae bacterium]
MLKDKILELLRSKDMEALKRLLAEAEAPELLQAFYELAPEEQVIVFRLLKKDAALALFEQLDTDEHENLFHSFTDEKTIEFIGELAPDDRVKLLDELPATVANKLLASLSPQERAMTNVLFGYKSETAGRIMTPEYITLRKDMTAAQAADKVRKQASDKETIYTLYVTDNSRRLEGVISLKELFLASPDGIIEDIMIKNVVSVSTDDDREVVARTLQELDLLALPVVDKEGRIVGIITIDDAMDILEEEATEDLLTQGGVVASAEATRSDLLVKGSLFKIWKVRLPFLCIALVGGLVAALVMEGFEEALQAVVGVAFFIPVIMNIGGSVGTQSSTVFARGVALGHIDLKRFFQHFLKEICVGASLGLITGVLAGIVAGIWQGSYLLGLSVGMALFATAALASLIGFFVPFMLIKMNFDQAAGAAPLVATIKDVIGLLVYFGLVTLFLSNLIGVEPECLRYVCECVRCANYLDIS